MEFSKVKKDLIKKMKSAGTYDKSFNEIIELTAQILVDLEKAKENFAKSGYQMVVTHTNKNGSKNLVKNPFYLSIEKLRDDSIVYLRELGLTPTGLKKIKNVIDTEPQQNNSVLEYILSNFEKKE
jgi:phage terminase, small subunit|nr:MAG TPA: terminase small subunit [Caudoviricetes sp.]